MSPPRAARTAWITGASSGIGRALALKLAAEGWSVAASARSTEALAALVECATDYSGEIAAFPLDIREGRNVDTVLEAIEQWTGPVDLAVMNAGTHKPDDSATLTQSHVKRIFDLNLNGTVNCLFRVASKMSARKSGHIAIVSSLAGYCGLPRASAYGASKAALINLAESLRPELTLNGVKLQIVNPGFVETPLTDKNDFTMPFLMPLEDAVEAFYQGLQSNRFEIVFPWRFAILMKLLRLLPYPVFFGITRRLLRK